MAITPVPPLTDIPGFPALSDRAAGTYNSKAFAFGTHMADTFNGELLAVANNVYANAVEASAAAFTASEAAAAAAAAAQLQGEYAAGTTYEIGQSVSYGGHTWFAKTINIGVTPATGANWQQVVAIASPAGHAGEVLTTDGLTTSWAPRHTQPVRRAFFSDSGTHIIPAGISSIRGYAFGAGAAGTTTNGGAGGGCAYGDIAVTPGDTVTVSIAAGVAKITTSAIDRLTANAASGITAGTASKHASVTNGGAYSGGAGGGIYGGASSGSPLGAGFASTGIGGSGWGGAGTSGSGGGVGGAGTGTFSGSGLPDHRVIVEPILFGLVSPGVPNAADSTGPQFGGPGAGGGRCTGASSAPGGKGGFGGGGGTNNSASRTGGAGGFGGGGGAGNAATSTGGAGGYGGGGGAGTTAGGAGGGAAAFIYY